MKFHRVAVAALTVAALSVACSSGRPDVAIETTTTSSSSTTIPTTTSIRVVTSIERVPASELTSVGRIAFGDQEFEFAFECYAAGAGDVLALGVGENDEGQTTQAIVQAFLGQPYVAVLVGIDRVYELAIDREADLFVQGGDILGSALRFVEAEEGAGVGTQAGLGTVTVNCNGFFPGLPEGYVLARTS